MRMPRFILTAWTLLLVMPLEVHAQGTKADYERADAVRDRTRDKVFKASVRPHWFANGSKLWYRNDLADGAREFIVVDAAEGTRRPAFDHAKLAEALARKLGKPQRATHLPVENLSISDKGVLTIEVGEKPWRFESKAASLEPGEPLAKLDPPTPPRRREGARSSASPRREQSPDGKWAAVRKDRNVVLRNKQSGEEVPLSTEGTEADGYESGVFWSPDSMKLVALRTKKGDDRKVYLIESSPRNQIQPKLQSYNYLKPGDQIPITKPHLFDVATHKEIKVSDELFPTPWEGGQVHWAPDSSQFSFVYNQRGHQVLRVIAVDAAKGDARVIIEDRYPTFVDYSQKFFERYFDDKGEILWMSERDGWNHLYLFDVKGGKLKNQVTKGEWVVHAVDRVDEAKRQVWFHAGGMDPGQDPYYIHFARVNFDGTGLVRLTEGDGTHSVEYSPDQKYLIDTYSRVDMPPVVELRSAETGKRICELERADASALMAAGIRAPERFVAKGRDGRTDIHGVIVRPTTFDPAKKYPVIESIYAGPQGAFVPKSYAPLQRTQSLAELGFVVVQIDGMGTNWRSKAFHDVCAKNLGDAGFPDRILWLKAAAEKYPYLDLTRVGLYGGSAGGQNALGGLLFHPEFYKVGVADCGCHDNRMDKIWWNEAWMGWPVDSHYAASSNVDNASKLRGKLMLTVGELDRNVDPASTMQVVNALIKANKDFELIVFPGGGHGAGSGRYGERRKRDFFVKHLLGIEPPNWNAEGTKEASPPQSSHVLAEREQTHPKPVLASPTPLLERSIAPLNPGRKSGEIRTIIEQYSADRRSLYHVLPSEPSLQRRARLKALFDGWLDALKSLDFDGLSRADRVDYVLLRNELEHELKTLDARAKAAEQTAPLLPFSKVVVDLQEAMRRMDDLDSSHAAGVLDGLTKAVKEARKTAEGLLKKKDKSEDKSQHLSKSVANRAAGEVDRLRSVLRDWYGFYNGYDPVFTWWAAEPFKEADKALFDYSKFLRDGITEPSADSGKDIVGDPIGRQVLLDELKYAMIPYTPEELVEIANKEFAWCDVEMKRAARDMGFGDDWKKALEKVKTLHVAPGKQPALIRDLALEAIRFLDKHDLVTVPPLARESWRMEMMSPQRQLVNPFFTGGEVISVSYPTSTMTHEQKLMSMRGNNIHFARATVHHELIPGHHLQGFMNARHRPYRSVFHTPFWTEGWALYWELLLWDKQFAQSPEDRVGMLFWRSHRCARIIFSLNFHLGKMTPPQCIDFLVDRVGHERDNATAEVRRSFNGSYEPLYQCAYMLGGLQLRALRRELVKSGKMTDRAFHDAILHENAIPIEMVRASLTDVPLTPDHTTRWRFDDVKAKGEAEGAR